MENKTFRANFHIKKESWAMFRTIAKAKHSDAAKELRKFIDQYIEDNYEILKMAIYNKQDEVEGD